MNFSSNIIELFEVSTPLPAFPENAKKHGIKNLLADYANLNDVILTSCKSKSHGFRCLKPVSDNEDCHNHSLNKDRLLTVALGRKAILTFKDLEKVNEGVERNVPTAIIQKFVSSDSEMNKLTVHDINNMKYSLKNKLDLKSEDGATVLLNYIESKQFITKYRCDPTTNALDGLFVINTTLIARAKQFSELVIIDATYNINSLRMPLICAYGVSNLGGMVLKAFPIAFLLGYL